TPPTAESAYGVYWPTTVPADLVDHQVVLPDGTRRSIPPAPAGDPADVTPPRPDLPPVPRGETRKAPLGRLCAARSGDKGGNANVGLWTRTDRAYAWLRDYLTTERLRELLTEAADLEIRRYELANLKALN